MAIDMNKMRERKRALDSRNSGNSNGVNFWRPQDGEQVIRIIPTQDGDPFKDYWFHYNVGNNAGFLSPKKNLERMIRLIHSSDSFSMRVLMKVAQWLRISWLSSGFLHR